ncbi:NADP-dependent oxidoreductase lnbE [Psilocybe cubensis]|uniref:NADP-dependent oxidoreductase lnbE n=2 Tax=Psilocybe cubensis TaxID=181762 RepID=A0ACB8GRV7_PSICU|nr:NADP-dependent oxidoreductase lnbE [Psilocybe cubensis]KAH9478473.1 NADP-dependent oxidoreductase lnbE [Psilocybe cubensis]
MALFTPLQIGDFAIKNRITMAAFARNRAKDTYPTELMKEYYIQRAKGGAGLIVTEAILVSRQGTEWPYSPGLWEDKHVKLWTGIVDAVHQARGLIYGQLWHAGRVSHPDAEQQKLAGIPVYAPSAIAARGGKFKELPGCPGYVVPTAIENPWEIVEEFRQAAINAKRAGFDGVELHGSNGYIIQQFLDSTSNRRSDEWGGSIENRSRFALEVLKVMIESFGKNVAVKLSPAGGDNDMGMPLQETLDTYSYFISEADKLGISYICLVRYQDAYDVQYDGISRSTRHDVLESYAHLVKNAKVIINACVTPEEGELLVASKKADAIAIGFNWVTHPDLANRVLHGKPLDNVLDMAHLQTNRSPEDWSTGYTDYPCATDSN